jgi:hypothetical protein
MALLPGSDLAGASQLEVSSHRAGSTLELKISGSRLENLCRLYVEVRYDAQQYGLLDSHPAPDFSAAGHPLHLSVNANEGVLHYGQVLAGPDPAGVRGSRELAVIELVCFDTAGSVVPGSGSGARADHRSVSGAVPAVDNLVRNAAWNLLQWSYVNPGDYDQNGVVNISDLTPLGVHFGAVGPFAESSARWMVDGDGNGEINLADITVIGQNFGNEVSGYELYAAPEGVGYPETASARLVASPALNEALGGSGERKYFRFSDADGVRFGDRYWVVPAGGAAASDLTETWDKTWHKVFLHSVALSGGGGAGRPVLELINDLPCTTWSSGSGSQPVYFASAANAIGSEWNSAFVVPTGSSQNSVSGLVEVDGRPAVLYNTELKFAYKSAANSEGTAWNAPVDLVLDFRRVLCTFQLGGKLHVASHWSDANYYHAGNAVDPTEFSPEHKLFSIKEAAAIPFGSGFANVTLHSLFDTVEYATYDVTSGLPVLVDQADVDLSTEVTDVECMLLFGNVPHVWLLKDGATSLFQFQALTPDAEVWTNSKIDIQAGFYGGVSVVEAYGGLFMSMLNVDLAGGYRQYFSADGSAAGWTEVAMFNDETVSTGKSDLMLVRGHPALVYFEDSPAEDAFDYYFARFY